MIEVFHFLVTKGETLGKPRAKLAELKADVAEPKGSATSVS
jgi:hypothetical protein